MYQKEQQTEPSLNLLSYHSCEEREKELQEIVFEGRSSQTPNVLYPGLLTPYLYACTVNLFSRVPTDRLMFFKDTRDKRRSHPQQFNESKRPKESREQLVGKDCLTS